MLFLSLAYLTSFPRFQDFLREKSVSLLARILLFLSLSPSLVSLPLASNLIIISLLIFASFKKIATKSYRTNWIGGISGDSVEGFRF